MASRDLASLTKDRSKTLLLKDRKPKCYRLLTHRQYLDGGDWKSENEANALSSANVRRWRFGNVDTEKKKKTILMLGETGTGKTTLINSIVTHLLGVKFEDRMWFEITEEEKKSQAQSQTACVTAYELYIDANPTSYTIIDTPGYGDTAGIKEDEKISKHLLALFTSYAEFQTINAIGLVVKASQNRLTTSQQYIFNEVVSLFGRDVKNSIVIFITHSDGLDPEGALNAIKEANIPCAMHKNEEPVYFSFNNTLLATDETEPTTKKEEKMRAKKLKKYEEFWTDREDSIDEFLEFLKTADQISLRMTEEVIKKRDTLQACIINLKQRVVEMDGKQKELEQKQKAVDDNKEKLAKKEIFEIEVEQQCRELVRIKEKRPKCEEKATHCSICKENCHFPGCTWVTNLWWCSMMKGGNCKVCSGGCSYKDHVKNEFIYTNSTRKVKLTNTQLLDELKAHGKSVEDIKDKLKKDLEKLKIKQDKILLEAYENIMKLQAISLKKDDCTVVVHLEFLITRLRNSGKEGEAKKLEEIQRNAPEVSSDLKALYNTM